MPKADQDQLADAEIATANATLKELDLKHTTLLEITARYYRQLLDILLNPAMQRFIPSFLLAAHLHVNAWRAILLGALSDPQAAWNDAQRAQLNHLLEFAVPTREQRVLDGVTNMSLAAAFVLDFTHAHRNLKALRGTLNAAARNTTTILTDPTTAASRFSFTAEVFDYCRALTVGVDVAPLFNPIPKLTSR